MLDLKYEIHHPYTMLLLCRQAMSMLGESHLITFDLVS